MLAILFALGFVGLILVVSEFLIKKKILHGEIARKFVHITAGTFMASWAFYFGTQQIQLLSIALLLGVILSRYLHIFTSVHGVQRKTLGEVFFALSVGLTATIAPNAWVYAAAILHMSLADGFAAVVGTAYGKKTEYRIMGQHKTLIGTLTFYLISLTLTFWLVFLSGGGVAYQSWLILFWLPLLTTLAENLAPRGLDNIIVPTAVVGAVYFVGQLFS